MRGGSKYGARKACLDGITFDSRKEGLRYLELKEMQDRGEISCLRRQVPYELLPAVYEDVIKHLKTKDKMVTRLVQRPVRYVADFVYVKDGAEVVEDVKGSERMMTPECRLKVKMMRSLLGIRVDIVV